ncbi:hypothetical protein DDU33_07290 [Actinobacillus porcitonsillarum]|uniref:Uncharacterized protein n=1 Tax=Actinobacillus porcitonsillarum TaxID=189834 RepID=A0A2U8FJY4_9PAST|nr:MULTISPECIES: DUF6572 domain-containing protein [Actinobacillus]AWI51299.1 hypothetical protein DDU33_07290 [Actinobacillus porcitonsillarum]
MSILDKNSIDIINIEGNQCFLIITDHLEWNDEHLYFLKDKLNLYLYYLESGEVYLNTSEAKEKEMVIKLICKFKPRKYDMIILNNIKDALKTQNVDFIYEIAIK